MYNYIYIYNNVCCNSQRQMLMTRKRTMIREQTVIININMYIYYYVLYHMYLNQSDMG